MGLFNWLKGKSKEPLNPQAVAEKEETVHHSITEYHLSLRSDTGAAVLFLLPLKKEYKRPEFRELPERFNTTAIVVVNYSSEGRYPLKALIQDLELAETPPIYILNEANPWCDEPLPDGPNPIVLGEITQFNDLTIHLHKDRRDFLMATFFNPGTEDTEIWFTGNPIGFEWSFILPYLDQGVSTNFFGCPEKGSPLLEIGYNKIVIQLLGYMTYWFSYALADIPEEEISFLMEELDPHTYLLQSFTKEELRRSARAARKAAENPPPPQTQNTHQKAPEAQEPSANEQKAAVEIVDLTKFQGASPQFEQHLGIHDFGMFFLTSAKNQAVLFMMPVSMDTFVPGQLPDLMQESGIRQLDAIVLINHDANGFTHLKEVLKYLPGETPDIYKLLPHTAIRPEPEIEIKALPEVAHWNNLQVLHPKPDATYLQFLVDSGHLADPLRQGFIGFDLKLVPRMLSPDGIRRKLTFMLGTLSPFGLRQAALEIVNSGNLFDHAGNQRVQFMLLNTISGAEDQELVIQQLWSLGFTPQVLGDT